MGTDADAASRMTALREELLADRSATGTAWCTRLAEAVDRWLEERLEAATGGDPRGVALLAVGGYGRGHLAPGSDLDLLMVHDGKRRNKEIADAVWYPIWDSGTPLDHSVRTAREVRAAMDGDIKVALGLLDARPVAGDADLSAKVLARAAEHWRSRAPRWLPTLASVTRDRHARFGDLAFLLEPDLKESRGGLRDATLIRSLPEVVPVLAGVAGDTELASATETLTSARVELQRLSRRPSGLLLLLQDQDAVAAALGSRDADDLMASVAEAGRTVAWASDDAWRRLESWLAGPRGRGGNADRALEPGVVLRDGEVTLRADADPASDPSLALRIAAASAELDRPMSRASLDRLCESAAAPLGTWPAEVLHALLRLLGAGRPAIAAVESLDQRGVWLRYLHEWAPVRNRPQRNAYHRFTVDRHLLETAAGAAALQSRVARPDLLLLGALLHDIGKGRGGDHTALGVQIVGDLGTRLGLPDRDVEVLRTLVRHHLLLPDAATRRDLDDPATTAAVAAAVGDRDTLELLAALTEADSEATGPAAWGQWKAGLVARLVGQVSAALEGRHPPALDEAGVDPRHQEMLRCGDLQLVADGGRVTVGAPDRPGLLATVAGVLTLAGATVRSARTFSDPSTGMALLDFEVAATFDALPDWDRVRSDMAAALDGKLALDDLLAAQDARYSRFRRPTAARPPEVRVIIDHDASARSTVVEVRAPDRGPVLYQLARALAGAGVTITRALVSTLGAEAIDVFYVRTLDGGRVDSPRQRALLADALRAAL